MMVMVAGVKPGRREITICWPLCVYGAWRAREVAGVNVKRRYSLELAHLAATEGI